MYAEHIAPHKEEKRQAVVERLNEIHVSLDQLSRFWSESTLDQLILALGIGEVGLSGCSSAVEQRSPKPCVVGSTPTSHAR